MKILIIEDEDTIREVEKAYLARAGYTIEEAANGEAGLDIFKREKIDLIVLDLNLPKIDGIEVCKRIRLLSNVPIIMVTARVEEIDEIIGLEIGADDYIKKPFSPNVLVTRVNALLRRLGSGILEIHGILIDPERMEVKKDNKTLNLTTTQFNILYTLAKSPGKVFTREEILDNAYNDTLPRDILYRTVDAHIKSIRKALEENMSSPKYIITVIGKGYKFNDSIEENIK